jgi:hypothetical protein
LRDISQGNERRARVVALMFALFAGGVSIVPPAGAQPATPPPDSTAQRLQRLADAGDRRALRRMSDSLLAVLPPLDPRYGEALYWRATLRGTQDSTRQDLLKLIVGFPVADRVEDALVRLADDETRAGDRASARRHLERLVRDHLATDRGAKAAQQFAQMLFDEGATAVGCVVLDSARAHASPANVELANQIAYTGRRCGQLSDRVAPQPDSVPVSALDSNAPRKPEPTSARPAPRTPAKTPTTPKPGLAHWSVQVAAYAGRGDALRLEARLRARGYDARIAGEKPYRVRIGRFVSRDSAVAIATKLKAEKNAAMIVEAERP